MRRKKKACKRWTQEENSRLIQLVSENGSNISNAFRTFIQEYPDRTYTAAELRWYSVLRKDPNVNVCLLTVDRKHKLINGKIHSRHNNSSRMRVSIWNRIINLIFRKE